MDKLTILTIALVILTGVLVVLTWINAGLTSNLTSLTNTITGESTSTATLIFAGGNLNFFLTPTNNTFATISGGSSYGGAAYFNLPRNCNYTFYFNLSIPFQFAGNPQTRINVDIFPLRNATITVSKYGETLINASLSPYRPPVNLSVYGAYITDYPNISKSFKLEQDSNGTYFIFNAQQNILPGTHLLDIEVGLNGYLSPAINYSNNPYLAFSIFTTIYPSSISINDYAVYEKIIPPTNSTKISGDYCFPFNANYN